MHGKGGSLTASEKRIAVTLFVGEAHEATLKDLTPTLMEKFASFGYLHGTRRGDIKLFTSPGYKFTPKDEVAEQFNVDTKASATASVAAAPISANAPAPRAQQRAITTFFAPKQS